MPRRLSWLRPPGLAGQELVLLVGTVLLLGPAALVGGVMHGRAGVEAAGFAALVCWFGGAAALVPAQLLKAPALLVLRVLLPTMMRAAFPLGAGVMVYLGDVPLVHAGFIQYLLVFYMVVLALDTMLSLPQAGPSEANSSSRAVNDAQH